MVRLKCNCKDNGVVVVVPSLVCGLLGRRNQRDILYIIWSGELFGGGGITWLPIGYVRGLLNRKDRKDILYIITLSKGIQCGKRYIREEESTE